MNVWQVVLDVTAPERPELRHQRIYRAPANSRAEALSKAHAIAHRDGLTVHAEIAATRGYKIK